MRKDRPRRWARGLAAASLVAWLVYKLANSRLVRTRKRARTYRQTDPGSGADMSRFAIGAPSIGCQSWDIGTGVAGYVWRAPGARGVLLLQHGLGEHAQRYVTQHNQLIPHLLHAGINVYAIDLWGHGRSPGRRAVTDIAHAVEDHLAARRKLQGQPLPVFVMGHSLGGLVTASSVARDPTHVTGVIITSAPLFLDFGAFTRLRVNVMAALAPTMGATSIDRTGITRIAEESEAAEHDPMIHHGKVPMLLAATALTTAHGNRKRYRNWNVPTLLLHGTADTITDPKESVKFHDSISSLDKTLHLVEGGYHELLNDVERDQTLQTLMAWLERRVPPRSAVNQ
jgi:alpha-beta hydrolase superfamily lysophospholipase